MPMQERRKYVRVYPITTMGETLKNFLQGIGAVLLSVLGLAAILGLMLGLIVGATKVSLWVVQYSPWVFWPSLMVCLFVLAPLALIPPTRGAASIGFFLASYIFGAITWCWGVAFTYLSWGIGALLIGLFMAGVGVVPIAMLAAAFHSDWRDVIAFTILLVLIYGTRALSMWLVAKYEERAARQPVPLERLPEVF